MEDCGQTSEFTQVNWDAGGVLDLIRSNHWADVNTAIALDAG